MQEQGSPPGDRSPSILVASGPQDEQAIALVQALRDAGLRVIFAETVTLAARLASEAVACVAVLRPDTWKCQTITVVTRARPGCLIPVLAEPMKLPRGPWTRPAIDLSNDPAQGTQELIQELRAYFARPDALTKAQRQQNTLAPLDTVRITPLRPRRLRKRRRQVGTLITTIVLLLIILGLGALLGYRYYTHPPAQSTPGPHTTTISSSSSYSASSPGTCDNGSGDWATGDRYVKDKDKKKVEVVDKYTTLQCLPDGAHLTRTGDYAVYSEIFFGGPFGQDSLVPHYRAQVDATILTDNALAGLTIDVHVNNYARYGFNIDADGRWEASVNSSVDGSPIKQLAMGFLKTANFYTLGVEVYGPSMTFLVNGTQITSVADTTYTENGALAFGVDAPDATSPVSALFSNFQYQALPNTLASPQIVATATAQAIQNAQTPYKAHIPGFSCDKNGGQWRPLSNTSHEPGTIHCLANGMQLTEPGNAKFIAEEDFYWLNGSFPLNYKVSAHVNVSKDNGLCAALGTREQGGDTYGSYDFMICSDGSWKIVLITNKFHTLAQGSVGAQSTYTLTAESNGSKQSLYINGQLMQTVTDTHLTSTDHISLDAGLYQGKQTSSVVFSDFIFTPLP